MEFSHGGEKIFEFAPKIESVRLKIKKLMAFSLLGGKKLEMREKKSKPNIRDDKHTIFRKD